ncbi:hypothetical protein CDAR_88591 [Caerostris darwini]|uniref:Uncharacterized protein n=1 Tax=Caerostris darwini TaxID=1538125 RepID=A0AAV4NGF2_9ARAC|nr:hypothetical protein CDAR_88591 [Caerostris darwini]
MWAENPLQAFSTPLNHRKMRGSLQEGKTFHAGGGLLLLFGMPCISESFSRDDMSLLRSHSVREHQIDLEGELSNVYIVYYVYLSINKGYVCNVYHKYRLQIKPISNKM